MISGAPVSICMAPAIAPSTIRRPPSRVATITARKTHGAQPSAAALFGHIWQAWLKPLKA